MDVSTCLNTKKTINSMAKAIKKSNTFCTSNIARKSANLFAQGKKKGPSLQLISATTIRRDRCSAYAYLVS